MMMLCCVLVNFILQCTDGEYLSMAPIVTRCSNGQDEKWFLAPILIEFNSSTDPFGLE